MEETNLQVNEKFFGFNGAIGRHTFFLNLVKIYAILFIFSIPIAVFGYKLPEDSTISEIFFSMPLLIQIITFGSFILASVLFISSMVRRLNDIFGKVNSAANIIFSILAILTFCFIGSELINGILNILLDILILVLLIKKGKITGVLPYDYKKQFNWGAFFGGWIWGVVNKSFATFWAWIVWLPPFSILFKLYCGLKGNEWAYKNKNYENVEEFNKSQRKQTTIFSILALVVFPIIKLFIVFVFLIIFGFIFAQDEIASKHPETQSHKTGSKTDKLNSGLDKFTNYMVFVYFEDFEISDNENKFYVTPNDWKYSTFSDKKDMLDLGATAGSQYRNNMCKSQNKYCGYTSKYDELRRTKIYNSKTNQLLGEYNDTDLNNADTLGKAIKSVLKAYKFYNVEK